VAVIATELKLGARASCPDGQCGEVTRTILDPHARTITHLIIEHKYQIGSGRLVPIDLVDTTGDQITLRCTLAEFDELAPAEEVELVEGVDYGDVGSMGVGASASGMGIGMGLGHHRPTVASDNVPEGESEVVRHEHIHATDGEIGRLKGFAVDPADHRVTHVLVREGHLWGRKEVAIPVSAVTSLDDGIWLNLTKQQVEELPPRN